MKQIPNIFTLFNLFFGCLAIICILQSGPVTVYSEYGDSMVTDLPEKIWWASVLIGCAAVIDFLDGFVARLFNATSEMGKQLDSLADVVSFGVAPGMILYQFLRFSYMSDESAIDVSIWALVPALLLPMAIAYRLARFNIDPEQAYGFKGVPAPAGGLVVASLPLIHLYNPLEINELLLNKWVLYLIIIGLSWLHVSTLPLMAMKFSDRSLKGNLPKILLVAIALIAAVLLKWLAVPVVFIVYIVLSLALQNKKTTK